MVLLEPIEGIEIELSIDEISKMEKIVDNGGYLSLSHQVKHRIVA